MSKHTPAPWQVMNEYDGATVVIANVDGETFSDGTSTFSYDFVCDTLPDDGDGSRSREIAVANARLIAAAPDMLEALKTAKETIRAWHGPNAWDIYDRVSPEMRVINEAIAKAEGQS